MIKKLNLSMNYPVSWSKWEVFRDYIQNFYDVTESDSFTQKFQYAYSDGGIVMQMEETFDKEWLFYIGASTKQEKILNSRFAGQFGEGFKVASLVAYRDFHWNIEMASKDWVLHVTSDKSVIDGCNVDFLAYEMTCRPYQNNSVLKIQGLGEEDYKIFLEMLLHFEYEDNPLFGECIYKSDDVVIYHTNPDKVKAGRGYAFVKYQQRAILKFPLIICAHYYREVLEEDDRDRKPYSSHKTERLLTAVLGPERRPFSNRAAYEILLSLQEFWGDCKRESFWANIFIALACDFNSDNEYADKFLKEFGDRLVARNDTYIERDRKQISKEWFKHSEFRKRRQVSNAFTLLGILTIEQLCAENDGFQVYRNANEVEHACIDILSKAAILLMGDVFCYDRFPVCGIVVNEKAPMEGLAKAFRIRKPQDSKNGKFVPVENVQNVYLKQYMFQKENFGKTLAVYMHELLHQFGGDSSMQFHNAIILMNERIIDNPHVIEQYEKKWRDILC